MDGGGRRRRRGIYGKERHIREEVPDFMEMIATGISLHPLNPTALQDIGYKRTAG